MHRCSQLGIFIMLVMRPCQALLSRVLAPSSVCTTHKGLCVSMSRRVDRPLVTQHRHSTTTLSSTPFASDFHTPVMCSEVLEWLLTDREGVYLDCTLGGGGHSEAILSALDPAGRLVSLDQDPDALAYASKRLDRFIRAGRFQPVRTNFRHAATALKAADAVPEGGFTGMLLDLGVSSHQLDEMARGFSFRGEGPLDMRMQGPDSTGLSADDLVNKWDPVDVKRVLKEYGEEPKAARIARAIAQSRPLNSTAELRDVVERQVAYNDRAKTLARVFQGLRIVVNGEMDALESVLSQATELIRPGGRMVVLSYHSLEDRRVKRFMRSGNFRGEAAKDFYGNVLTTWRVLTPRSLRPTDDEVAANGRARSVSMRVAERTPMSLEDVERREGQAAQRPGLREQERAAPGERTAWKKGKKGKGE